MRLGDHSTTECGHDTQSGKLNRDGNDIECDKHFSNEIKFSPGHEL